MISADQLRKVCPSLTAERAAIVCGFIVPVLAEFEVNRPARAAAFVAQYAHETGGFWKLSENLNYSAEGLLRTFPSRFGHGKGATGETRQWGLLMAQRLARKPVDIANFVYASRLGNGPSESGDGYRYRGGGLPHLTFRDNYRAAGKALCLPLEIEPDLIRSDGAPAYRVGGWYWKSHGCNELADRGDFRAVTKRIAGALTGLTERLALCELARQALGGK